MRSTLSSDKAENEVRVTFSLEPASLATTIQTHMNLKFVSFVALALGVASTSPAAIIGTNTPAEALTAERIATLPWSQRSAWKKYLKRSERQMKADKDFFQAEMKKYDLKISTNAPAARRFARIPLDEENAWYGGDEARRIADIIVSFQTPAGGWSKNLDMTRHIRVPGEAFTTDNNSRFLRESDYDTPHETSWNYVGTFDNDATTTQLRFLAKVVAALPAEKSEKYRAAFLHGLDYIFAAQYPNGGWPQVWPLQGGYHDAITYNDNAVVQVLELLLDSSNGMDEFAFVPKKIRKFAAESWKRGIECILATQIIVNGRRTVWGQQHDALTLKPVSARNYEMPALCSRESAGVISFLMDLPKPSRAVVAAVHDAAAWFERTKILDMVYTWDDKNGRDLFPEPGADPLWARFYDIGTGRPIFGDRDQTIHDTVSEISAERRRAYAWFVNSPARARAKYAAWSKAHPLPKARE